MLVFIKKISNRNDFRDFRKKIMVSIKEDNI